MLKLIAFVIGITLCAFLADLPNPYWCLGLGLLGWWLAYVLPLPWRTVSQVLLALLLGLGYASLRAEWRMAEALPVQWQQTPIEWIGIVRDLPNPSTYGTRLEMEVERTLTPDVTLPSRVLVTDYRQRVWPVGSRWQLSARFKRRHGLANAFGFDIEQKQWSDGILASGSVGKSVERLADTQDALAWIDRARAALVAKVERVLGVGRESALIAALTVGAQQRVDKADWQLFSATGLTHLVSISGLHITMLAGLAALAARSVLKRWPIPRIPPRIAVALIAFVVAAIYSLLAGFTVPTQRTLYMLGAGLLMLCWRRALSPFRIWWLALALVLVLDPFCVLAPGVWLSFGLVAALMATSLGRRRSTKGWRAAVSGQWAAGVCSLVPLAWWFNAFPLVSPLANALAIPYVSILVTPLALFAVLMPFDMPLYFVAYLVKGFYLWVEWLAQWPAFSLPDLPWPLLLLALLGSVLLIAPRGVPGRGLGGFLLLPMLCYQPPTIAPGQFRATVLDVGQGLSVLVQTAQHALLYDTGLPDAGRIVLPTLHGLGVKQLDVMLLSHHDNDHDGAAVGVAQGIKVKQILAGQLESLSEMGLSGQACVQGRQWDWDGVRFSMLSPAPDNTRQDDNSRSCILRVSTDQQALLLMGDAPLEVEQDLLAQGDLNLRSTVLIVGHHGSKTSTGWSWLQAVLPDYAVISAGYLNRYRHPHPSVMARLQQQSVPVLRTDLDGALTLDMSETLSVSCLRQARPRYWRERGPCGAGSVLP